MFKFESKNSPRIDCDKIESGMENGIGNPMIFLGTRTNIEKFAREKSEVTHLNVWVFSISYKL